VTPTRVYVRKLKRLLVSAVGFRNDLPQTLDEAGPCQAEVNEDLFVARAPVWSPPTGELDEELRVGVAMLAVDLDPCGMSPLKPSAMLV
jgi:hypothetical protein